MSRGIKLDSISSTAMETKIYSESSSTVSPLLLERPKGAKVFTSKVFDSFRNGPEREFAETTGAENGKRFYNQEGAVYNTAHGTLNRRLKGRHLQMIAIGGSIGTGLFIGSGAALQQGGPASLLLAYLLMGSILYCTVQALGEMAVTFPISGSFCAYSTRFVDPAWGFAQGWNYAMNWLFVMPLEIMAAAITLEFWDTGIPSYASITLFLVFILAINLSSIKVYGETEYVFSIIKVTAIIGFIILGVVINCGGGQDEGYVGGKYWVTPGAFNHGFKGFCTILTTAAFAFSGTELVGLAAAETYNPSKSLPSAIKQTFWRITLFYIVSVVVVGLLVPSTSPQLVGRNDVDAKSSPFIVAITGAGIQGLDSVMNAIVLISVLSVANSSMFASSRTLVALAEQGQAPLFLARTDRKGRPLYALILAALVGLLAYLYATPIQGPAFTWLLALAGLSAIFNWLSISVAHIKFRRAWAEQGNLDSDLIYRSPVGAYGSWAAFSALVLVLAAEFWTAIAPQGYGDYSNIERLSSFFEAFLAMPVVFLCYVGYKTMYRTKWVKIRDIDLQTGRNEHESDIVRQRWKEDRSQWPKWKRVYSTLC